MRKLRLLLVLALIAGVAALTQATATTASAQAELDPQLAAAMAGATGPLEVVVTFKGTGAPTSADVQAQRSAGVTTGFTYRRLPIAGVLATPAQITSLSARPEVVSVWANRPLRYENYEATILTGVDAVRADATLTAQNGGTPIDGQGAGILVNDSGIDGSHADLDFGPHVVQNVEAATNLRAWSDLLGGFDYAIANKDRYGLRVITNSWGDTSDSCTPVNPEDPVT